MARPSRGAVDLDSGEDHDMQGWDVASSTDDEQDGQQAAAAAVSAAAPAAAPAAAAVSAAAAVARVGAATWGGYGSGSRGRSQQQHQHRNDADDGLSGNHRDNASGEDDEEEEATQPLSDVEEDDKWSPHSRWQNAATEDAA
eukprot:COSAG06_NODE_15568_length_1061_cov_1.712058_1_plen_141_part_10